MEASRSWLHHYRSSYYHTMDYTALVMPSLFEETVDFGPSDFFSSPFLEEEQSDGDAAPLIDPITEKKKKKPVTTLNKESEKKNQNKKRSHDIGVSNNAPLKKKATASVSGAACRMNQGGSANIHSNALVVQTEFLPPVLMTSRLVPITSVAPNTGPPSAVNGFFPLVTMTSPLPFTIPTCFHNKGIEAIETILTNPVNYACANTHSRLHVELSILCGLDQCQRQIDSVHQQILHDAFRKINILALPEQYHVMALTNVLEDPATFAAMRPECELLHHLLNALHCRARLGDAVARERYGIYVDEGLTLLKRKCPLSMTHPLAAPSVVVAKHAYKKLTPLQ